MVDLTYDDVLDLATRCHKAGRADDVREALRRYAPADNFKLRAVPAEQREAFCNELRAMLPVKDA